MRARRRCASSASRGTTTCSRRWGPPSTRASRWWPIRSRSSAPTGARCSSTPSTSSTATAAIPSSRCGCSKARSRRAPRVSCSATPTAARCPTRSSATVRAVVDYFGDDVGIAVHLHDDAGTGVANALAGVRGGAMQVQGTINGYGERTGNCNLTTIIPNLTLKMGIETIPPDRLERLTPVAHHVAELVNMALNPQAPYVGSSAFAHKAGLHVERDRQASRRLRARRTRFRRQRDALRGVGAGGEEHAHAEGEGARAHPRRPAAQRAHRHAQAHGARRATTSKWPTRRSNC